MATILTPGDSAAVGADGCWLRWGATNLEPLPPFGTLLQRRQRLQGDVAWLVEPVESDVVELGSIHIDHAAGPRPRRVELREGCPAGRLVRAFDCEPGQGLEARDRPDRFKGGIFITLVGDADVSMSIEYR